MTEKVPRSLAPWRCPQPRRAEHGSRGGLIRRARSYPFWSPTGRHARRIEAALALIEANPERALDALNREVTWFYQRYERDVSLGPHLAEAYRALGLTRIATGGSRSEADEDLQMAVDLLEYFAQSVGTDSEVHYRLGRAYACRGTFTKAAESFQASYQSEASRLDALLAKGKAEFASGNYKAAAETLAAPLAADPTDVEALIVSGYAHIVLGELDSARGQLQGALPSGGTVAWRGLAIVAERSGQLEEAARIYSELGMRARAALVLMRHERPDEALSQLSAIEGPQRETVPFRMLVAGCELARGKLEAAVQHLRALPQVADARRLVASLERVLGNAAYGAGDLDGAIEHWTASRSGGDRSAQVRKALGAATVQRAVLRAAERPEDAREDLEAAEHQKTDVVLVRALLDLQQGRADVARAALAELKEEATVLYHLGLAHLRAGDLEEAETVARGLLADV